MRIANNNKSSITTLWLVIIAAILSGCANLPENSQRTLSYAFEDNSTSALHQLFNELSAQHDGQDGFLLLNNNLDAFASRLALIDRAERSIDTQYYILDSDITGQLFLHFLVKAANRGVRVRLLVDDLRTDKRDAFYTALHQHPNLNIRTFNPSPTRGLPLASFLTDFKRLDRRMHTKSLTIDGIASFIGGRNIGDDYFSASNDLEFGDLDVLSFGPVSARVSAMFDEFWNDEYSFPFNTIHQPKSNDPDLAQVRNQLADFYIEQQNGVYLNHLRKAKFVTGLNNKTLQLKWGTGKLFFDSPRFTRSPRGDRSYSMVSALREVADSAREELVIVSPYFIPSWDPNAFDQWRANNVDIKLLTNSLASNDVPAVHSGYAKYRVGLLKSGVKIHELKPDYSSTQGGVDSEREGLHAKAFAFDRKRLFVGSLNLDPRSIDLNTECGILIEQAEMAENFSNRYDAQIETIAYKLELVLKGDDGKETLQWIETTADGPILYEHDPKTSRLKRIGSRILGVLPGQSEL